MKGDEAMKQEYDIDIISAFADRANKRLTALVAALAVLLAAVVFLRNPRKS